MAGTFDPYYEWLGIAPRDQPPDHYRLLGVDRFESSEKVIENAADRQMSHLRTFQSGEHSPESQRLLNEISAARVCLLNAEKKAAYDAKLRAKLGAPASRRDQNSSRRKAAERPLPKAKPLTGGPGGHAAEPSAAQINPYASAAAKPSARRDKRWWQQPAVLAGGGGGLVVLLVVAVLLLSGGSPEETVSSGGPASGEPTAEESFPAGSKKHTADGGSAEQGPDTNPFVQQTDSPKTSDEAPTPPEPDNAVPATPPGPDSTVAQTPPEPRIVEGRPEGPEKSEPPDSSEPAEPAGRLAVPGDDGQREALGEIKTLLADRYTELGSAASHAALSDELLKLAAGTDDDAVARYVLLDEARRVAAAGNDLDRALAAGGEMARLYEVDAWAVKVRAFEEVADAVTSTAERKALAAKAVDAVDAALAAEALEAAEQLADLAQAAARRALDAELRVASRSASERVKRQRGAWQKAQEAIQALEQNSEDAEAHGVLGRYLCLARGDWPAGLAHLAKGSDTALKDLAQRDLARPEEAAEQLELAEAWYALSQSQEEYRPGKQRAGHWFYQAREQLEGLALLSVEKRLKELGLTEQPRERAGDVGAAPSSTQRQVSLVPWTSGKPPVRLLRNDHGFCFLGGVQGAFNGYSEAARVTLRQDGFWCLDGQANQPIGAAAMVVPTKYRQLFEDEVLTFACGRGEGPIKMIHQKDGFCYLSAVGGNFAGGGEEARVYIDPNDGFWYLSLKTQQPLSAQACAMRLKESGAFGAVVTEKHWHNRGDAVQLLETDEGFCFLSAVGGAFGSPQDGAGIVLRDGIWYLEGEARDFLVAKATCIQVPDWEKFREPSNPSR